jgi:predicted nucleotidyltransferase
MLYTNKIYSLPSWLDKETQALILDILRLLSERHPDLLAIILYGSIARHDERSLNHPYPSDVDLLAILDSSDPHIAIQQGDKLFHTLNLAYLLHLDAPREVHVQFSSCAFNEWDPTFIANIIHDGLLLFARDPSVASFIPTSLHHLFLSRQN